MTDSGAAKHYSRTLLHARIDLSYEVKKPTNVFPDQKVYGERYHRIEEGNVFAPEDAFRRIALQFGDNWDRQYVYNGRRLRYRVRDDLLHKEVEKVLDGLGRPLEHVAVETVGVETDRRHVYVHVRIVIGTRR